MDACAGLSWGDEWTSVGEGPYTRFAKLLLANPLPFKMVHSLLMARRPTGARIASPLHPRSLLCNRWMILAKAGVLCAWSREVSEATLTPVLGEWAERLASDQALRYCPSCLAQGFQSALCQIDALTHCPVHGDALRTTCSHCDAPMPRYAWDQALHEALPPPMHCIRCGRPFTLAWQSDAHFRWRSMPGAEAYAALSERLKFVTDASWSDARAWGQHFLGTDAVAQRLSEFALVQRATRASLPTCFGLSSAFAAYDLVEVPANTLLETNSFPSAGAAREGALAQSQMRDAYVSACRRVEVAALGMSTQFDPMGWSSRTRYGALQPENFNDVETAAACLFRLRFERGPGLVRDLDQMGIRHFRPLLATLQANFRFDGPGWRTFFEGCYAAELRFVQLLRELTQGLSRGSAAWREALSPHAVGLIPEALELPLGAGLLKVTREGQEFGVLAFAASPEPGHRG